MRKRLFLSGLFSSIFILVCIIAVIPVAGIPPQQLNATEQQATVNALVNERLTATSIIQTNMVATSEAATIPSATPIPTFTLMPTATFEGSFGSGLPTRSIVIDVSQDAFEHYIAGWEHYWRGDYRDAEDEFDEAIDLEPEWVAARRCSRLR